MLSTYLYSKIGKKQGQNATFFQKFFNLPENVNYNYKITIKYGHTFCPEEKHAH